MVESVTIRPQKGPQEAFLSSAADICIYGGAAGGGKTFGLLLSPLRYIENEKFRATIFRHNSNQIFVSGGLLDESKSLYPLIPGATSKLTPHPTWEFDSGAKISFAHIERDDDLFKWQGSQICEIGFDELTHFSKRTFFFMLSRNRSTCGVKPYVRATCNPDADSWVAEFISWWIDQETGYPIKERSGLIRWMIQRNDMIYWADKKSELIKRLNLRTSEEQAEPKSVTFIASSIQDNKILLSQDPGYLANLKAMPTVEKERLLYGNWKIKPSAGLFFKKNQIGSIINIIPSDVTRWVRAWDLAATSEDEGGDPAYTSGVLMGKRKNGRYIIADVVNIRQNAADVRNTIKLTAQKDRSKFTRVKIKLPQDPGQAGKDQAQSYIMFLSGFDVSAAPESGSKQVRAEPMAAQWQAGNFDLVAGAWNEAYLNQLESFPISKFKDMVDASSSAFAFLESEKLFNINSLIT
ncbi:MAG: phage terminase large subunit [Bacillota bacterium]|nr:phage terminase large subunit [Bacillota bacterium]